MADVKEEASRKANTFWDMKAQAEGGPETLLFFFFLILLYNTVLVLPYINMNPPRVYMSSQSWTPLPPPSPYHLSESSQNF